MSHPTPNSTRTHVDEDFSRLPEAELNELEAALRDDKIEAGANVTTLDDYGTAVDFVEQGGADVLGDPDDETKALGPGARSERSPSS